MIGQLFMSAIHVFQVENPLSPYTKLYFLSSIIMNPYITYNDDYQVLICHQHQYAVSLKSIEKHYRDKHDGISLNAWQEILDYSSTLSLCEPKDIVIPTEIVAPIIGFEV